LSQRPAQRAELKYLPKAANLDELSLIATLPGLAIMTAALSMNLLGIGCGMCLTCVRTRPRDSRLHHEILRREWNGK
jgi:hypothetical protein